jgi:hypothetical protein
MTKDEQITEYEHFKGEDPTILADLYLDFYYFDQIEFLIFRDRLSSAILMSNAAQKALAEAIARLEAMRADGSYIDPHWPAESGDYFDTTEHVTNDAYRISLGATIVTAVAALESLLIDLTPDPKPQGLSRLLQAFLDRYDVPGAPADALTTMSRRVAERRNTFAHSLYGSYWETDSSIAAMFTPETMEDTLHTVGRIAVAVDQIVQAGRPSS